MAQSPTPHEQLFLELVNLARAAPRDEAARLGIDLNTGLPAGWIDATPKQPLAFDLTLVLAARLHSEWMLQANVFSHVGAGGSSPGDRMAAAGYRFEAPYTWAENLAWSGETGRPDPLVHILWQHEALIHSPSHRVNLFDPGLREIGIGVIEGMFSTGATDFNAVMSTQVFAATARGPVLTGVVIDDRNGNGRYDIGEGLGGVTVTATGAAGTFATTTWASGGYTLALPPGQYDITFSGTGIQRSALITIGDENVKLDADFSTGAAALPDPVGTVYRFFNTQTGTHFYTADPIERDMITALMPSLSFEGSAFKAPGGVEVYRFFNTETGTHLYTMDTLERDMIRETMPMFRFEGVSFAAAAAEAPGLWPLHRFFNAETGAHFYTACAEEREKVEQTLPSFSHEGVAFWVALG